MVVSKAFITFWIKFRRRRHGVYPFFYEEKLLIIFRSLPLMFHWLEHCHLVTLSCKRMFSKVRVLCWGLGSSLPQKKKKTKKLVYLKERNREGCYHIVCKIIEKGGERSDWRVHTPVNKRDCLYSVFADFLTFSEKPEI